MWYNIISIHASQKYILKSKIKQLFAVPTLHSQNIKDFPMGYVNTVQGPHSRKKIKNKKL